ncbi:hypothetical protein MGYG_07025 [Nannizzia gypsea CBS 118893]|uniref:Uncharacterized protein n=1 Tax=Arthroderma gypseum (strain ATCC MYA-4604 / CBS 118893) TaxID=535722 RepID=E4V1V5_ARTGP|nr:hypothetical protein MGYG_07025 [Nannizzia gypsea CBS 118893]EFR04020.1 hypothetical protein MGYG_07025 [Nannizzia gypsea CBS 118893]
MAPPLPSVPLAGTERPSWWHLFSAILIILVLSLAFGKIGDMVKDALAHRRGAGSGGGSTNKTTTAATIPTARTSAAPKMGNAHQSSQKN